MIKIMSLLACVCIVLVFIEFQSLVDGLGMSFVGGIICPGASQTCCDINYVQRVNDVKNTSSKREILVMDTLDNLVFFIFHASGKLLIPFNAAVKIFEILAWLMS